MNRIRKCIVGAIVVALTGAAARGQSGVAPEPSKELSAQTAKTANEVASPLLTEKVLTEKALSEKAADENTSEIKSRTPVIVVGFTGGFVARDNKVHSPVQIADRLKQGNPQGVYVEVFENRRREEAHLKILKLLGSAHNGKPTNDEKRRAQIIIYGMSWGGSETVALARELEAEQIPVLLTVQVDSVAKFGEKDEVIPGNVGEAANFFQMDGLLHGQTKIRAADEKKTKILGNFRMEYKKKSVATEKYPWWDRAFVKYHTEIEADPEVWNRVQELIQGKLPGS